MSESNRRLDSNKDSWLPTRTNPVGLPLLMSRSSVSNLSVQDNASVQNSSTDATSNTLEAPTFMPTYVSLPTTSMQSTYFPSYGQPFHANHDESELSTLEIKSAGRTRPRKSAQCLSTSQSTYLEKIYAKHKYINKDLKRLLSSQLALSPDRLKQWFQNRRTRDRHQAKRSGQKLSWSVDTAGSQVRGTNISSRYSYLGQMNSEATSSQSAANSSVRIVPVSISDSSNSSSSQHETVSNSSISETIIPSDQNENRQQIPLWVTSCLHDNSPQSTNTYFSPLYYQPRVRNTGTPFCLPVVHPNVCNTYGRSVYHNTYISQCYPPYLGRAFPLRQSQSPIPVHPTPGHTSWYHAQSSGYSLFSQNPVSPDVPVVDENSASEVSRCSSRASVFTVDNSTTDAHRSNCSTTASPDFSCFDLPQTSEACTNDLICNSSEDYNAGATGGSILTESCFKELFNAETNENHSEQQNLATASGISMRNDSTSHNMSESGGLPKIESFLAPRSDSTDAAHATADLDLLIN